MVVAFIHTELSDVLFFAAFCPVFRILEPSLKFKINAIKTVHSKTFLHAAFGKTPVIYFLVLLEGFVKLI